MTLPDIKTPVGRLITYPNSFPKQKKDRKDPTKTYDEYSYTIVFNPEQLKKAGKSQMLALKELREANDRAWESIGKKNPGGNKAGFRKTDDKNTRDDGTPHLGYEPGQYFITASTTRIVPVLGRDGKVLSQDEIDQKLYSGCYIRANVTPSAGSFVDDGGMKVSYVKYFMQGLQIIADGDRLGGMGMSAEQVAESLSGADEDQDALENAFGSYTTAEVAPGAEGLGNDLDDDFDDDFDM